MKVSKRTLPRFLLGGHVSVAVICSCLPTDTTDQGSPPTLASVSNATVYVTEPIDFHISATDPEGDAVTYSLSGAPSGATVDPSSGLFSWRPALADTGAQTIEFRASDGTNQVSQSATFTVVMPVLDDGESIRILRPAGGETYTYGDTITVAFAMRYCGLFGELNVYPGSDRPCAYTPTEEYGVTRGLTDSTDITGRVCRYSRTFPDRWMWLGFYRLPLVNTTIPVINCPLDFGGGAGTADSILLYIRDPYGKQRNPSECHSEPSIAYPAMTALENGVYSGGYFSVVPNQ